ncbi:hypothetical protein Goari_026899 [Gossypium aridum]|uniref:DUF4283 domain-containing protein n=1 Tax=Gossypium aridum TaxID=34290 RepID=A0A7J8YRC1_GOSAI|nr:hypothetical protein [Gossypium aridum]
MVDNNGGRPNTGIRRVTKKVKRRPESSQEADDPTVDGDGQQIQNQDTTRISYKATLMGDVHEAVQHIRMEEGFELQDGDVRKMSRTVIVKLLGSKIGFNALNNKITLLWKPKGSFQLMDLDNEFYLVQFDDTDDYKNVLTGGPWVVYGLLEGFYSKVLLRAIGQIIGPVIKLNINTNLVRKGHFTRLAVCVDLQKLLISKKRVEEEAFGPWMLVERHHWGKARSNGEPRNSGQRANQGGSRFSILEKEDGLNHDVFSGQVEDM